MGKGTIVGALILIIIAGIAAYYTYVDYLPGKVVLSITDPPLGTLPGNSQYSSSISHIYLTYLRVDIHATGAGNSSNLGWYSLAGGQTIDLLTVLNIQQVLGTAKLSTGNYDQIRMLANTTTVDIAGTNYVYNIPSGRVQVAIMGGGFQITVGQTVNVLLTMSFSNSEILAHGPNLNPAFKAQVVS